MLKVPYIVVLAHKSVPFEEEKKLLMAHCPTVPHSPLLPTWNLGYILWLHWHRHFFAQSWHTEHVSLSSPALPRAFVLYYQQLAAHCLAPKTCQVQDARYKDHGRGPLRFAYSIRIQEMSGLWDRTYNGCCVFLCRFFGVKALSSENFKAGVDENNNKVVIFSEMKVLSLVYVF